MSIADKSIKFSFLREFHLIMEDLDRIFSFVDPSDENENTFSHRTYELLLRACTAFEAVSKRILVEEKYNKASKDMNITDYFTLNAKHNLSGYQVLFDAWTSGSKIFTPFKKWGTKSFVPLPWYLAYNNSKHDRHQNFKEANLRNLMDATSGLFVLLYSQYQEEVFGKYQKIEEYHETDDGYIYYNDNSIFAIKKFSK